MLQLEERVGGESRWRDLCCDDADDFEAMKGYCFSAEDFAKGEPVVLLRAEEASPLPEEGCFLRRARIKRACLERKLGAARTWCCLWSLLLHRAGLRSQRCT